MKQYHIMTVDLGTSFIKCGIFNLAGERVAAAETPVKSSRPVKGAFIQRGEDLYQSVLQCMKEAAAQTDARQVSAITFTGQMAGFMGVGDAWEDVTGWSCSLDVRFAPYARRQLEQYADLFLRESGVSSPLFSTKLAWFQAEYPAEAAKIKKYVMISSYIIGRLGALSLEEASMDCSYLAWTGLADMGKRTWSEVLCKELSVDRTCLPRISSSDEVVGHLAKEAAALVGLTDGIPLISGAGDKIASCVGIGVLEEGETVFEASSYGGTSTFERSFRPDVEMRRYDVLAGTRPGEYYTHYYIPGSGITLQWYMDQFVREQKGQDAFFEMETHAAEISPGSDGLMAVGMFGGTSSPYLEELRGSFSGITWTHTRAHFYRALLESFSYEIATSLERVRAMYPERPIDKVALTGGGARSALWGQMLADVTGVPFERIDRGDVSLWGAAMLAASGAGLISELEKHAKTHCTPVVRFLPRAQETQTYTALKQEYLDRVYAS